MVKQYYHNTVKLLVIVVCFFLTGGILLVNKQMDSDNFKPLLVLTLLLETFYSYISWLQQNW